MLRWHFTRALPFCRENFTFDDAGTKNIRHAKPFFEWIVARSRGLFKPGISKEDIEAVENICVSKNPLADLATAQDAVKAVFGEYFGGHMQINKKYGFQICFISDFKEDTVKWLKKIYKNSDVNYRKTNSTTHWVDVAFPDCKKLYQEIHEKKEGIKRDKSPRKNIGPAMF